ncbi:MAG: hypothetical protein R6V23_10630 [Bacteroidales bacterium]
MQNITSSQELKEAIQLLEAEQSASGQVFKDQFFSTLDSLRPVKLIESTLKDIITSPSATNSVLDTTIGMTTGYLSRKIVVGRSRNAYRKILGSFLQRGVTNFITRHPEAIKSIGLYVINQIHSKKERDHEQSE